MRKLLTGVKNFVVREEGLELAEYALMLALLALAIVVAIGILSGAISTKFTQAAATI